MEFAFWGSLQEKIDLKLVAQRKINCLQYRHRRLRRWEARRRRRPGYGKWGRVSLSPFHIPLISRLHRLQRVFCIAHINSLESLCAYVWGSVVSFPVGSGAESKTIYSIYFSLISTLVISVQLGTYLFIYIEWHGLFRSIKVPKHANARAWQGEISPNTRPRT